MAGCEHIVPGGIDAHRQLARGSFAANRRRAWRTNESQPCCKATKRSGHGEGALGNRPERFGDVAHADNAVADAKRAGRE